MMDSEGHEHIEVKPHGNPTDRCLECHAALEWRNPTQEEKEYQYTFVTSTYHANLVGPEDILLISNKCNECGAPEQVIYRRNEDGIGV